MALIRLFCTARNAGSKSGDASEITNNDASAVAVYQTLFLRYQSNTDLQWRVPSFVVTAEAFVFAGLFTLNSKAAVMLLGLLGFLLAIGGSLTMRRLELAAILDRGLLDIYETRLLPQSNIPQSNIDHGTVQPWPALLHVNRLPNRAELLARVQQKETDSGMDSIIPGLFYGSSVKGRLGRLLRFLDRAVLVAFPPSLWWFLLLATIGLAALGWSTYVVFLTG